MVGPVIKRNFKVVKFRVAYGCRVQHYNDTSAWHVEVYPPAGYHIGRGRLSGYLMNLSGTFKSRIGIWKK